MLCFVTVAFPGKHLTWCDDLTHCILVDSSTVICCTSPFVILGVVGSILSLLFYNVASDLGLHCLLMTLLRVSM